VYATRPSALADFSFAVTNGSSTRRASSSGQTRNASKTKHITARISCHARADSRSTLLTRNLQDVFGENDPARRRAAIDEIWTEDGVFYDPKTGVHRGRDEIDRVAGAIRATHPDFRYEPIAEPEELGNGGRLKWVAGRLGEAPAYAETDFIIARDGQIAALYFFFDELP
jgi:SnoaL-like domain